MSIETYLRHVVQKIDKVAERSRTAEREDKRLDGGVLLFARGIWIVGVLLAVGLFVVSLPAYFAALHVVCIPAHCNLGVQLSAQDMRALEQWGISPDVFATLQVLFTLLFVGICVLISLLIFWRKSTDIMGLLSSFVLIVTGITLKQNVLSTLTPFWKPLIELVPFLGNISGIALGYLFPGGTFVPRWTRWMFLALVPYLIADTFFPVFSTSPLAFLIFLGVLVSMILVQIYRYRSVSTIGERQQTKWVVFGIAVTLGSYALGLLLLFLLLPRFYDLSPLVYVLGEDLISCFQLAFPLTLGFAILRYRFYDIDILINRTVVYGLLTGSLLLLYSALIVLTQFLLNALTRQIELFSQINQSPVIIVCSTLAVAALFRPLRRSIQRAIDRRFYRGKYDAVYMLDAFTATLHQEVDLQQLSTHLLTVVQETMQPTHVSLWLKPLTFDEKFHMDDVEKRSQLSPGEQRPERD